MNYLAIPIEGSIIDLPIDPRIALKWVTNTPGGGPIKKQPKIEQPAPKLKDLGEERHYELLDAVKGLKVSQSATQNANVTEALKQNRDWR